MCILVGFKKVVAKTNGEVYFELHLLQDDRYVTGQIAFNIFVRKDMINNLDSLVVGSVCEIYYNRFGKVDRVVF